MEPIDIPTFDLDTEEGEEAAQEEAEPAESASVEANENGDSATASSE